MPNDGEKVDLNNELDEDILDSPSKNELQANPDGRYDLKIYKNQCLMWMKPMKIDYKLL